MHGEGSLQLGRIEPGFGLGQALATLRGRVQGVAEQEGLFGAQEEVGRVAGVPATVGDEVGGAANRVGDAPYQVGSVA